MDNNLRRFMNRQFQNKSISSERDEYKNVLTDEMSKTRAEIKRLRQDYAKLQVSYNDLQNSCNELKDISDKYDSLQKQYDKLKKEKTEYAETVENLKSSVEKISSERDAYKNVLIDETAKTNVEIEQLQQDYAKLQVSYNDLQDSCNELKDISGKYDFLQKQYDKLKKQKIKCDATIITLKLSMKKISSERDEYKNALVTDRANWSVKMKQSQEEYDILNDSYQELQKLYDELKNSSKNVGISYSEYTLLKAKYANLKREKDASEVDISRLKSQINILKASEEQYKKDLSKLRSENSKLQEMGTFVSDDDYSRYNDSVIQNLAKENEWLKNRIRKLEAENDELLSQSSDQVTVTPVVENEEDKGDSIKTAYNNDLQALLRRAGNAK